MTAALTWGPLNTYALNNYGAAVLGYESFEIGVVGATRHFGAMALHAPGLSNHVIQPFKLGAVGVRIQRTAYEAHAPGYHNVAIVPVRLGVVGASVARVAIEATAPGQARQQAEFAITAPGVARMQLPFEITAPGMSRVGLGYTIEVPGVYGINQSTHTRVYRQRYHVEEAALERWELYVGIGAAPDLDGSPVATGTTSPVVWNPPLPDPGETSVLHIVVLRRNAFDLTDFNCSAKLIEIDENGNEVLGPLTAPELARVLDGSAEGGLQVWARYAEQNDRNPADYWDLYATAGAPPTVGLDTPVLTDAMGVGNGEGIPWRGSVTLVAGATYYVMVVVRRDLDGATAQSEVAEITLASLFDIDADNVTVFGGEEYDAQQ